MMKKLVIFAVLAAMLLGVAFSVSAEAIFDEVVKPEIGGKYYLCATVDGTDYYYRVTNSTLAESVTDTNPYSFYVTSDTSDKNLKEFTLGELGEGFYMGYESGQNIHKVYSADITMNGEVDTGLNSGLDVSRHCFYWDGANNQIFCMKSGEKYILAVKTLKNKKTGAEELHMLSVPQKEVADGKAVAVRFVSLHEHVFSDQLTANEYSHWFPCPCGAKDALQMHQVENWTVTKEAAVGVEGSRTGTCTVCGETAVEAIPALKDKADEKQEPEETEESEETKEALKPDPILIAVAAALVVLGVVIIIFGKAGDKKKKSQKD